MIIRNLHKPESAYVIFGGIKWIVMWIVGFYIHIERERDTFTYCCFADWWSLLDPKLSISVGRELENFRVFYHLYLLPLRCYIRTTNLDKFPADLWPPHNPHHNPQPTTDPAAGPHQRTTHRPRISPPPVLLILPPTSVHQLNKPAMKKQQTAYDSRGRQSNPCNEPWAGVLLAGWCVWAGKYVGSSVLIIQIAVMWVLFSL